MGKLTVLITSLFVISVALWVASFPRWELAMITSFVHTVYSIRDIACMVSKSGACSVPEKLVFTSKAPLPADCNASHFDISVVKYTTSDNTNLSMLVCVPKKQFISPGTGKLPVLYAIHGGGWVLGNFNMSYISTYLSPKMEFVLFSPQYRLAPDFKFPTAVNDVWDGFLFAAKNAEKFGGDSSKIFVGGVSAGGNLAAVTSILARDRSKTNPAIPKIFAQILQVPVTAMDMSSNSFLENIQDPVIPGHIIYSMRNMYAPAMKDWSDPRASPLFATSHEGLPPAFIISCSYDPLYDDAVRYLDKLKAAKVEVEYYNIESYHGGDLFGGMFGLYKSELDELGTLVAQFIRKSLHTFKSKP